MPVTIPTVLPERHVWLNAHVPRALLEPGATGLSGAA
jgi:hypothetical protein